MVLKHDQQRTDCMIANTSSIELRRQGKNNIQNGLAQTFNRQWNHDPMSDIPPFHEPSKGKRKIGPTNTVFSGLPLPRRSQQHKYRPCSLLRSQMVPFHAIYPEQLPPLPCIQRVISYCSAPSHTDISRICLPKLPTSSSMVRPALHFRFAI